MQYRRLAADTTEIALFEVWTEGDRAAAIGVIAKRVEDPYVWWIVAPQGADPGPYVRRTDAATTLLQHRRARRKAPA